MGQFAAASLTYSAKPGLATTVSPTGIGRFTTLAIQPKPVVPNPQNRQADFVFLRFRTWPQQSAGTVRPSFPAFEFCGNNARLNRLKSRYLVNSLAPRSPRFPCLNLCIFAFVSIVFPSVILRMRLESVFVRPMLGSKCANKFLGQYGLRNPLQRIIRTAQVPSPLMRKMGNGFVTME